MGESTDGLASSTSKLREEMLALTGVDIMKDDKTFKSTYDMLLDISKVFDQLDDTSQAAVLEKIAGKVRSSVVAGLIKNMGEAEKVVETSANAAGSALEENERYMESIQGHLDVLTSKWQELWANTATREFINSIIDMGSAILDVVNNVGLLNTSLAAMATYIGAKSSGRFTKSNLIEYATVPSSREVNELRIA